MARNRAGGESGTGQGGGGGDFVSRIVSDPSAPPDLTLLSGYPGASPKEGHTRLYLDPELADHVDIPNDAILHSQPSGEDSPLARTLVWIRRDAQLLGGPAGGDQARGGFFDGPVFQNHFRETSTAQAAAGAQAGPGILPTDMGCRTVGPACRTVGCSVHRCPSKGLPCPTPDVPCVTRKPPICTAAICPSKGLPCPGPRTSDPLCQSIGIACTVVSCPSRDIPCITRDLACNPGPLGGTVFGAGDTVRYPTADFGCETDTVYGANDTVRGPVYTQYCEGTDTVYGAGDTVRYPTTDFSCETDTVYGANDTVRGPFQTQFCEVDTVRVGVTVRPATLDPRLCVPSIVRPCGGPRTLRGPQCLRTPFCPSVRIPCQTWICEPGPVVPGAFGGDTVRFPTMDVSCETDTVFGANDTVRGPVETQYCEGTDTVYGANDTVRGPVQTQLCEVDTVRLGVTVRPTVTWDPRVCRPSIIRPCGGPVTAAGPLCMRTPFCPSVRIACPTWICGPGPVLPGRSGEDDTVFGANDTVRGPVETQYCEGTDTVYGAGAFAAPPPSRFCADTSFCPASPFPPPTYWCAAANPVYGASDTVRAPTADFSCETDTVRLGVTLDPRVCRPSLASPCGPPTLRGPRCQRTPFCPSVRIPCQTWICEPGPVVPGAFGGDTVRFPTMDVSCETDTVFGANDTVRGPVETQYCEGTDTVYGAGAFAAPPPSRFCADTSFCPASPFPPPTYWCAAANPVYGASDTVRAPTADFSCETDTVRLGVTLDPRVCRPSLASPCGPPTLRGPRCQRTPFCPSVRTPCQTWICGPGPVEPGAFGGDTVRFPTMDVNCETDTVFGASDTVNVGGGFQGAAQAQTLACPPQTPFCPPQTPRCPQTAMNCPQPTPFCPPQTLRCPQTANCPQPTPFCPPQTLRCPQTANCPQPTPFCPPQTLRCPQTLNCPPVTRFCPRTVGCPATQVCPTRACPFQPQAPDFAAGAGGPTAGYGCPASVTCTPPTYTPDCQAGGAGGQGPAPWSAYCPPEGGGGGAEALADAGPEGTPFPSETCPTRPPRCPEPTKVACSSQVPGCQTAIGCPPTRFPQECPSVLSPCRTVQDPGCPQTSNLQCPSAFAPCPTAPGMVCPPTQDAGCPTAVPMLCPTQRICPSERGPCPTTRPRLCPTNPVACPTQVREECPTARPEWCPTADPWQCPTRLPQQCPSFIPQQCPTRDPLRCPTVDPRRCPSAVDACPTVHGPACQR